MKSKLILVEGLPGSGKSTTAQLVFDILKEFNVEAKLFTEGDLDHPADYEGVACYSESEFRDVLATCPLHLKAIREDRVIKQGEYYLLPYRKIENELDFQIPSEVASSFHQHDIYELPLQLSNELITARWRQFAEQARSNEIVYIFECCFIQNPVTLGMIKYDASKDKVIEQVTRLAEIIAPLNPLLIYVEQTDLDYSFRKAVDERSAQWSNGFIHYYTTQGYGKARGYTGLAGTLQILQARSAWENDLLDQLQINIERVNNSSYDLTEYKAELVHLLKNFSL
ncbi:hypothetical protein [Paenibacillus qinlingensis]|uniref:Adenylyl-sulfate kinase n=1 Tax=Paenibacillus qinlingensis TaxID=1837343 RepID=A0ABU1NSL7_9BACL|nr:hypothetical protein [Paenibacillus qinlingensis]MDR6550007.1 hypothetical protein [Paenibacillus qinlingensis]